MDGQCGKLMTVIGHQFVTLTVDISVYSMMGTASRGSVSGSKDLLYVYVQQSTISDSPLRGLLCSIRACFQKLSRTQVSTHVKNTHRMQAFVLCSAWHNPWSKIAVATSYYTTMRLIAKVLKRLSKIMLGASLYNKYRPAPKNDI